MPQRRRIVRVKGACFFLYFKISDLTDFLIFRFSLVKYLLDQPVFDEIKIVASYSFIKRVPEGTSEKNSMLH